MKVVQSLFCIYLFFICMHWRRTADAKASDTPSPSRVIVDIRKREAQYVSVVVVRKGIWPQLCTKTPC